MPGRVNRGIGLCDLGTPGSHSNQAERLDVMSILHSTHIGSTGMKSLARSYIYWPRPHTQIEEIARTCETCGRYDNHMPHVVDHL